MSDWTWQEVLVALCFVGALACALVPQFTRPKRNRAHDDVLPPPSDACKRNTTQAVP